VLFRSVVAKDVASAYEAGRRSQAWLKVKPVRTADCVAAGFRWVEGRPLVASLLLGLYDASGDLRHVGVAASFPGTRRRELVDELRPAMTSLAGHPWEHGFALERGPMGRLKGSAGAWDPATMEQDWVPLRPELVCEVGYDQVDATGRWRHPARFLRWRPDRDPASCTFDQIEFSPPQLTHVLGSP
jgi:ATP-dependent DNA ligase